MVRSIWLEAYSVALEQKDIKKDPNKKQTQISQLARILHMAKQ